MCEDIFDRKVSSLLENNVELTWSKKSIHFILISKLKTLQCYKLLLILSVGKENFYLEKKLNEKQERAQNISPRIWIRSFPHYDAVTKLMPTEDTTDQS